MSDIHDRLNELANRGTPRGFDHVLEGAASAMDPSADGDDADGDLEPIPFVTADPVARRRRPLGSMIAAAGVAALVLVGAFAVSAFVGSGGSGSAEGAVRRLADALSHEDPLAAADVLAPDEVRSLHGTLDDAERKAAELQLVQTAGAPLAGVDFNVDGLKLSTESLGDGYTKVTIDAGTFSASTHKKQFSPLMQKVLRNTDDNSAQSDLAKLAADNNLPTFVVAVRRSGSWYVSAAYTVLEYVREYNHLPAADFGSGEHDISSLGADSPDAAVQDSMRALQRSDWSKLMSMVSPNEIPVYDYRAALTALIRKSNSESGGPATSFTIDSMSTSAQVSGDTAKVTLKASGTTDSGKWSLDGGCFTPPDGTPAITCRGGGLFGVLALPFAGLDQSSQITVDKRDGRWFVSPVGTVLDVVDRFITQLDRRTLFTLIGIPNELPPDGSLTLGKPFVLNAANQHVQVLTFEGRKGQQLLGLAKSQNTSPKDDFSSTSARVFAPDGSELDQADGMLYGQQLVLPGDGKYTIVVQALAFGGGGDVTVTVWDATDAPAAAKQDPGNFCTISGNSQTCSSSGSSSALPPRSYGGKSPAPSFCDADGRARVGPNREMLGADGKPMLDEKGKPVLFPNGFDPNTICALTAPSSSSSATAKTAFSGTDPTAVPVPTFTTVVATAPNG